MAAREAVERARRPGGRRLELRPAKLKRRVDPKRLAFRSTEEVEPLVGTIGQPRALDALEYGLEVETRGFNLFVSGAPGSGRLSTVLDYLRGRVPERPVPDDWIYVHNFENPDRPNAICMATGRGSEFSEAMDAFVEGARREISRAFESEEYEHRQWEVLAEFARERERREQELTSFAAERNIAVKTTLTGVASVPIVDGKPITRSSSSTCRRSSARRSREAHARSRSRLPGTCTRYVTSRRRRPGGWRSSSGKVAVFATEPLYLELEERFGDKAEVLGYLADVKGEMLAHLDDFRDGGEATPLPVFGPPSRQLDQGRFRVNVFVDNSGTEGAPIVIERNPTYYNLLGRIEYHVTLGAMVTDFREIKPGALHRANGGFLVLDLLDVLRHPFAWEALKRALRSGETRIENLGEEFSSLPSATIRPEPIPLHVKVVLLVCRRASTRPSTRTTRTFASCSRSRPTSRPSSTGPVRTTATTQHSSAGACETTACVTSTRPRWPG